MSDYITAAYTHEIAPLTNPAASGNWWESAKNLPTALTAVGVSAGVGILNIPTTLASIPINLLGGDYDGTWISENDALSGMDNALGTDLETYYNEHDKAIDGFGFAVGSLVPGLLGVKAMRVGLSSVNTLSSTAPMNRALGIAQRFGPEAIEAAKKEIIHGSPYTYLNANALKVYAAGAGHGVIDALAYNTAATIAMHTSPYLEDKSFTELTKDVLWDSVVWGGGFGAVFDISGKGAGIFGYKKTIRPFSDTVANLRATALAPFERAGDIAEAGAKYQVVAGKKVRVETLTPGDEILMKLQDVKTLDTLVDDIDKAITSGLGGESLAIQQYAKATFTKLREEAITSYNAKVYESTKKIFDETADIVDVNGIAKQLIDKSMTLDTAASNLLQMTKASRLTVDELSGLTKANSVLVYPASKTDKFHYTNDPTKAVDAKGVLLKNKRSLVANDEAELLQQLGLKPGAARAAIDEAATLAGYDMYQYGDAVRSIPKFNKKGIPIAAERSRNALMDIVEGKIVTSPSKATAWDLTHKDYKDIIARLDSEESYILEELTPLEISALYRRATESPLKAGASTLMELDVLVSRAKAGETIRFKDVDMGLEEATQILRESKNDLAVRMAEDGFNSEQIAATLRVSENELARLPYPDSVPSNIADTSLNRARYINASYAKGRDMGKWELDGRVEVAKVQQLLQKEIDGITASINKELDHDALVVMDAYSENFVAKAFSFLDAKFGKIFEQSISHAGQTYSKMTQRAAETRVTPIKTALETIKASGVGSAEHTEFVLFNTWNKLARNKANAGHSIAMPQQDGSILFLRRDVFEAARQKLFEADPKMIPSADDILAELDVAGELAKKIGAADSPAIFRAQTEAVKGFISAHSRNTAKALSSKNKLRQFHGQALIKDAQGPGYYTHYDPSVNVRNYQHVLVIRGEPLHQNPMYAGQTYVFAARSADEIRQAEAFAAREGLRSYTKGQTQEFYKMIDEYEHLQTFNTGGIKEAMESKGKLTSYLGAGESLEDTANRYLDWHLRDEISLNRNAIALKEHKVVNQLKAIDLHDRRVLDSKKGTSTKISQLLRAEQTRTTGPEQILNTLFNTQSPGIINAITKGADDFGIGFVTTVRDFFSKVRVQDINNLSNPATKAMVDWMDNIGVEKYVTDDIVKSLGIKSYDSPAYAQFVRMSNMALVMGQLRLDAINSLINMLSLPILGSSTVELAIRSTMTKLVQEGRAQDAANLKKALYHKEGSFGFMPSQYLRMGKQSIGRMDMKAKDSPVFKAMAQGDETLAQFYLRNNITFNPADVAAMDLTEATITGLKTGNTKAEYYTEQIQKYLGFLTKPTDAIESRLQFIAADSATQIAEAANLSAKEAVLLAHTMVNKLQGNFTASMKPQIFQGITGSAIGLFQSYQARLIHRLSDAITDGNKRMVVEMAMLQTSIFGGKSLPFFDTLNASLVADNNQDNQDIYSTIYGSVDRNIANMMVYGLPSALLGLNLSSRGNTTPRVPQTITDIPAVNIWYKQLTQMKDIFGQAMNGADPGQLFNHALQHNVFSRPLQQFAVTTSGYSTTRNNKLAIDLDDARLMNENNWMPYRVANFMRIAGTRPLDEQVFLDTVYRWQGFALDDRGKREELGRALSSKMLGKGDFEPEEVEDFLEKYLRAGGTERGFHQFLRGQAGNSQRTAMDRLLLTTKNSDRALQLQYMLGAPPESGKIVGLEELIPGEDG